MIGSEEEQCQITTNGGRSTLSGSDRKKKGPCAAHQDQADEQKWIRDNAKDKEAQAQNAVVTLQHSGGTFVRILMGLKGASENGKFTKKFYLVVRQIHSHTLRPVVIRS